jgi:hypothetical protein
LDRLGHDRACQQPRANLGRIVKPQKMLAVPARSHFGVGGRDVVVERLDGLGFEIQRETDASAGNSKYEEEPGQIAATTSR